MNLGRFFTLLTIFGLLCCSTTGEQREERDCSEEIRPSLVVRGKEEEETADPDVQIGEEDEAGKRAEDTATPASDILVSRDQRLSSLRDIRRVFVPGRKRRRRSQSNSLFARFSNPSRLHSTRESERYACLSSLTLDVPHAFLELIAGKLTRLLVGARNNGSESYLVESIDASLRYPQDYTYYIQNFTVLRPERVVESGLESTFEYLFMPSETFNGRPMGLVVLLNYRNSVRQRETSPSISIDGLF